MRQSHPLSDRVISAPTRSPVAQLAEHSTVNRRVTGSSPVGGAHETPGQRLSGRVFCCPKSLRVAAAQAANR